MACRTTAKVPLAESDMADDKRNRGERDRSRVSGEQDYEQDYSLGSMASRVSKRL